MKYPVIRITTYSYVANTAQLLPANTVTVGAVVFRGSSASFVGKLDPGVKAVNLAGGAQSGVAF